MPLDFTNKAASLALCVVVFSVPTHINQQMCLPPWQDCVHDHITFSSTASLAGAVVCATADAVAKAAIVDPAIGIAAVAAGNAAAAAAANSAAVAVAGTVAAVATTAATTAVAATKISAFSNTHILQL